ncbi:MAG: tRNA (N(6)-L-threonylcarbamoyladenosine(37)-C(2))-methylthiotransferase [Candidatus Hodarchaeales archaeon]
MEEKMEKRTGKTATVLNFGCSANRAIAEGISGTLRSSGYDVEFSGTDADVIVVNTCIVKQNTEHRMKSLLLSLPIDRKIIVTGCLPVVMQDWIDNNVPHVRILYPENADEILSLIDNQKVSNDKSLHTNVWQRLYAGERIQYNPLITTIEISRGCLGNCAYCIVKHAKGHLRSRKQSSIIDEVHRAMKGGSREIWLTSQDTGTYGWDFTPRIYLPSLIEKIIRTEYNFFLRLGMMTPFTVSKFIQSLITQVNHPNVFSFLHLPIQAGSDRILKQMRRKETRNYFIELVQSLKSGIPNLVLATDIIVGFPGESEEDYEQTESLLREVRPIVVNISRYTDRPGTQAAKMGSKIPTKIKSSRSRRLLRLCQEISRQELKSWIGWTGKVLIDEVGKQANQVKARNEAYLPVIITESGKNLGTFHTVTITSATSNFLIGEIR